MADLIMLKFDRPDAAEAALGAVAALEELHYAWVDDVAVVERTKRGIVKVKTPHGSAAEGALLGGLLGLLLFWWFPPAWFFGGWLAGVGLGALAGEAMKRAGIDEQLVDEVKRELTPGSSALLLIGASGDVDEMAKAFEPYRPTKVIRRPLSDQTLEQLKRELEGGGEPAAAGAGAARSQAQSRS